VRSLKKNATTDETARLHKIDTEGNNLTANEVQRLDMKLSNEVNLWLLSFSEVMFFMALKT